MRILLAAMLILSLCGCDACTFTPQSAKPNWAMATSGEQYERLLWNSVKAKNWRDVEAHLAGTLVTQDSARVRNKQEMMDDFHSMILSDFSLGDVKSETAGSDLVVTYTISLQGTFNGHPLDGKPVRMMSVWQQVSKGMVLVAHSSVPSE